MYLLALLIVWGLVMLVARKRRPTYRDSDDGFIAGYLIARQQAEHRHHHHR